MATQTIDERFDLGIKGSEPKKIVRVYNLSDSRLIELLGKLDAHEHFDVFLRGKGFEIYGEVNEGPSTYSSRSFGIITSGYNIGESDSCTFLVTFDYNEGDARFLVPTTSLADVVRDYIVM